MSKKKWIIIFAVLAVLIFALPVLADSISVNAGLGGAATAETLGTKVKDIVTKVGSLIGVIAICALIFNGFKLGTASDERKRAEALDGIKWALIAVVIVGLAVMGVGFVASLVSGSSTGMITPTGTYV